MEDRNYSALDIFHLVVFAWRLNFLMQNQLS